METADDSAHLLNLSLEHLSAGNRNAETQLRFRGSLHFRLGLNHVGKWNPPVKREHPHPLLVRPLVEIRLQAVRRYRQPEQNDQQYHHQIDPFRTSPCSPPEC